MKGDHVSAWGERRAALLLHAMSRQDRAWLLQQLPPAQRVTVDGLLGELRDLGIPPDGELLEELTGAAPARFAPPAQRLDKLKPPEIAVLARALAAEPAELAARVLAIRAWPWRAAVGTDWDAAFRNEVACASPGRGGPAAADALCKLVVALLDGQPAAARAGAPSAWEPLGRRLRLARAKLLRVAWS